MTIESQKSPPGEDALPDHIEQNIESMLALQRRNLAEAGISQRLIERVSGWMSRPTYVIGLLVLIFSWVVVNWLAPLLGYLPWDRSPFAALDSVMTLVGLLTGTVVLVAQHRQSKLEQQHTQLALQIGLLTEQKSTKIIHLLEELRRDLPMVRNRHDPQAQAMQESPDTEQLLAALQDEGAEGSTQVAPGDTGRGSASE
jgi:uncharacterized membrane protein